MRGRKPKTVERQIAEGDPRKHGVGKLQERLKAKVKARSGLPRCPTHLRGRARACWNMWKRVFGSDIHYAQLVKVYAASRDGEQHSDNL